MSAVAAPPRPYKGLTPFEDAKLDELLFFGREREREIVVANLMASRLTVLYGPSGVGKTSLLRAGVARHLRALPDVSVALFSTWADDPTAAIDAAIDAAAPDELYVILDQVEEYFLYHGREGDFARRLPELVTTPGLRVNVLLGIREDALAKLDAFKGRIPNLFANYLRLDHLDREAARAAIVGPIERWNELTGEQVRAEPELVEDVLDQVAAGKIEYGLAGRGVAKGRDEPPRIEAPYLQLVLDRLWEAEREAGSELLRLETLQQLGGAQRIVQDHLERALASLSPRQRETAAGVFNYLVTPSGTKIAHGIGDLAGYAGTGEAELRDVLGRLAEERIVRPLADGDRAEQARYEIFHDVLAEGVLAWRAGFETERELERERRRNRRALTIAGAALLALAGVAAIALFAVVQWERAQDEARHARGRELAARALAGLEIDPQQSLRLAVQAARDERTEQVEDVLRRSLLTARLREILPAGPDPAALAFARGARLAVADRNTVAFHSLPAGRNVRTVPLRGSVVPGGLSSDGRFAATTAPRGLRIWDLATVRLLRTIEHPGTVRAARIDTRGRLLATVARDRQGHDRARLFRVADGRLVKLLPQLGVKSVAFSPDGRLVATGSADRTARLWRTRDGKAVRVFPDLGHVLAVAFSPDGKLLMTGSADGAARVFDLATGSRTFLLIGHTGFVVDVAFSPDGRTLATASRDRTARLWDAANGFQKADLAGHGEAVTHVAYGPHGEFLATASEDGTVRVWDARPEQELVRIAGRHDAALGAAFSGSATAIAAFSDGTADVVDIHGRRLGRFGPRVKASAFGAGGGIVALGGADGVVRLRRSDGRVLSLDHGAPVVAVAAARGAVASAGKDRRVLLWSASGAHRGRLAGVRAVRLAVTDGGEAVAAGTADGAVYLWRPGQGTVLFDGHVGPVTALAFSRDGRMLVSAGEDAVARVWDVERSALVAELRGHLQTITDAEFSPDGRLVVTSSRDQDARLWDARTWQLAHVLRGHFSAVNGASFSPDGRWVVTAGPTSAGLWPTRTGRLSLYLRGHALALRTAEFSPDGRWILTASDDGTVRLYRCRVCGRIDELVAFAKRRLARPAR